MKIESLLKRIGKIILILLALLCLKDCLGLFYLRMTHLTSEDLEWINGAKKDLTATFVSNLGHVSRLKYKSTTIANNSNPFYISSNSSNTYEANAWIRYEVIDSIRVLEGSLGITKMLNNDSIAVNFSLGGMFNMDYGQLIRPQQFSINNRLFDNCIIVDSMLAENSPYWVENKPLHLMDKFVISKDYGLIYYKLKDGEEFFRQFDEP